MNNKRFWKEIWDSKGKSDNEDLLFLDGYDHLKVDISSKQICDNIIETMNIKEKDTILEVGCGAGFLARELQLFNYVGVDYSEDIIKKHKKLFPTHNVLAAEANYLPFENNSFDKVFCFGVFQYLPNKKYADKVIDEMKRVASKSIFLGDLKSEKTRNEHFVYSVKKLRHQGFEISNCVYESNDVSRFNAYKEKIK